MKRTADLTANRKMGPNEIRIEVRFPTKAYRGSRGETPLILNFCTILRRVVNFMFWPRYPGKEPRYPVNGRLGGPRSTFWRKEKYLAPNGIRTPDRPAGSLVATPTTLLWLEIRITQNK
jgi:hypothetical protein